MFQLKYRIVAKHGGVVVNDEKTNSLRVVNDVVRALVEEGNEVIVYEDGRPHRIAEQPTGIVEVDDLLADFFAFEAAVRGQESA